ASVSVDGSLTTSEVHSALGRTLDALRGCYRAASQRARRTSEVTLRLSFEIDEAARATRIRVAGDSIGLGGCGPQAGRPVRAPRGPGVGTVAVSAVIRFRPIPR